MKEVSLDDLRVIEQKIADIEEQLLLGIQESMPTINFETLLSEYDSILEQYNSMLNDTADTVHYPDRDAL